MYSIEYAILQLEKFRDNNKIIESDYDEYYKYFTEKMDKQNIVQVEDEIEEQTENIEENDTVDDTVEETENQEEVKSAE